MPRVVGLKILFVSTEAVYAARCQMLTSTKVSFQFSFFFLSIVSTSRTSSGKLFQTVAAECLKPRAAKVVPTVFLQITFLDDNRRVRTGA